MPHGSNGHDESACIGNLRVELSGPLPRGGLTAIVAQFVRFDWRNSADVTDATHTATFSPRTGVAVEAAASAVANWASAQTQQRTAASALHDLGVVVITETRYGGVYEGGPWAAFSVSRLDSVPGEAFGGDTYALDWWDRPTIPVGAGDSPDEAFARLGLLVERDRASAESGLFSPGDLVLTARCTPDDWYPQTIGTVLSVEFRPCRPYVGGLAANVCTSSTSRTNAGRPECQSAISALRPEGRGLTPQRVRLAAPIADHTPSSMPFSPDTGSDVVRPPGIGPGMTTVCLRLSAPARVQIGRSGATATGPQAEICRRYGDGASVPLERWGARSPTPDHESCRGVPLPSTTGRCLGW